MTFTFQWPCFTEAPACFAFTFTLRLIVPAFAFFKKLRGCCTSYSLSRRILKCIFNASTCTLCCVRCVCCVLACVPCARVFACVRACLRCVGVLACVCVPVALCVSPLAFVCAFGFLSLCCALCRRPFPKRMTPKSSVAAPLPK